MFALLKKDFLSSKLTTLFVLAYIPIFTFIFAMDTDYYRIDILIISVIMLLAVNVATADVMYSQFILSLPVNRKRFIISKYLFFMVFSIVLTIIANLEITLLRMFNSGNVVISMFQNSPIKEGLNIISLFLIVCSVSVPLGIFLGGKSKKIYTFIITFSVVAFSGILSELINLFTSSFGIGYTSNLLLLLASIILSIVSMIVTVKIYEKRDL